MSGSADAAFALSFVVAGTGTVAAVVALFAIPFVPPLLLATVVRADVCVFLGVVIAGPLIACIWVFESGGWLDFRPVMTVGVVLQLGLWCVGVWAGRRVRARRVRLRNAPVGTA